jgi:hypothetical protein
MLLDAGWRAQTPARTWLAEVDSEVELLVHNVPSARLSNLCERRDSVGGGHTGLRHPTLPDGARTRCLCTPAFGQVYLSKNCYLAPGRWRAAIIYLWGQAWPLPGKRLHSSDEPLCFVALQTSPERNV